METCSVICTKCMATLYTMFVDKDKPKSIGVGCDNSCRNWK